MPPLRSRLDKPAATRLLAFINAVIAVQHIVEDPFLVEELNRVASGAHLNMPINGSLRTVLDFVNPRKSNNCTYNRGLPIRNMDPCVACATSRKKCVIVTGPGESRLCQRCKARGETCIRPALESPSGLSDLSSLTGIHNDSSEIVSNGRFQSIARPYYASGSSSSIVNEWYPDECGNPSLFQHPFDVTARQPDHHWQEQSDPHSSSMLYFTTPSFDETRQS